MTFKIESGLMHDIGSELIAGLLWAQVPSSVWSGARLEGFLDPESLRMAGLRKLRASLNVPPQRQWESFCEPEPTASPEPGAF